MSRKVFIAGNWKMNTTVEESIALAKAVVAEVGSVTDVDVAVCPPYTSLYAVAQELKGSNVKLGAQDVHWEEAGAYTGKISCSMLKSVGVEVVLLGHSEQRSYFGETDATVNKKLNAVLAADMIPVVCIGETLEERENGTTNTVLETQIKGAYEGISKEDALKTVIAYEPVWAIGTGKVATPDMADETQAAVRAVVDGLYGAEVSEALRIQYGGSMKPNSAKDLLAKENIDGGLIGGAALNAADFKGIVIPQ